MGLLSKIKNVLFEEEEIEIPVFKKEPEKTQEEPIRPIRKVEKEIKREEVKEVKKEKIETPTLKREVKEDNERETFKTEPTFQFPVFDENEFNEQPKRTNKVTSEKNKNHHKKIDFGRFDTPQKPKEEHKKFVPSPVISPVFGVLDKNYVKRDLKPKQEVKEKVVSIDDVRNKAYGSLEEQIESTFNTPVKEFYEEQPSKTINDLLIDSATDEIPINDVEMDDIEIPTQEEIIDDNATLDVLDELKKDTTNDLEDTLESDLFNLIDSMYTNKEEEK